MKSYRALKPVGVFLIVFGGLLLFIFLVIPYSRLLGKEFLNLSEDKEATPEEPNRRPPILPVYSRLRSNLNKSESFYLTIRKLGVENAHITTNVAVDNLRPNYLNALLNSLAQLSGTSLPGDRGNSIIFGHSALPYLYNPRNFQTIFSKIDELRFGDIIELKVGDVVLRYKVEKGGLVDRNAVVSDFNSNRSRVTLLTCYPPGFKSQKYAVRALLID